MVNHRRFRTGMGDEARFMTERITPNVFFASLLRLLKLPHQGSSKGVGALVQSRNQTFVTGSEPNPLRRSSPQKICCILRGASGSHHFDLKGLRRRQGFAADPQGASKGGGVPTPRGEKNWPPWTFLCRPKLQPGVVGTFCVRRTHW